jgi:hypothetical protein
VRQLFLDYFQTAGRGRNIVLSFLPFQTEYSLASADAKTSTKGSVAPTIQQQEKNQATINGGLCAGQFIPGGRKSKETRFLAKIWRFFTSGCTSMDNFLWGVAQLDVNKGPEKT